MSSGLLILIIVLVVMLGGGGGYYGWNNHGPAWGVGGFLIPLLVLLIVLKLLGLI